MDIDLEVKWLYIQYKKGLGVPDCWDVDIKENICYKTKDKNYPIFIHTQYAEDIHDINDIYSFVVIESAIKCIWFSRNNVGKYIKVCKLGEGKKTEVDVNRLIEMRSEIMGIINHLRNSDYGLAEVKAELIREKLNKLI